jgi:glycosyltransferase involved in cell wall biosynthesis
MSVQMYLPPDLRRGNDAETRMALADIIRRHFQTSGTRLIGNGRSDANYLKEFPFEQVRYLFVSSQIRPHKNLANLISAFDYLLRQRYLPLKLFTTGDLSHANQDVRDLIATRHLDLDVIGVPNLPAVVHAAFYRLAELTVVPTLFEGGLPFPFSESLSVGTPVVLSRIPAVCEALPRHLWPLALFDPYDTKSIADRIEWGLEHREILLVAETDEYASMTKRTWSHVAGEYLAVLRQTADSHAAFRPISRPHWGSQSWQYARAFRPNSTSKPGN